MVKVMKYMNMKIICFHINFNFYSFLPNCLFQVYVRRSERKINLPNFTNFVAFFCVPKLFLSHKVSSNQVFSIYIPRNALKLTQGIWWISTGSNWTLIVSSHSSKKDTLFKRTCENVTNAPKCYGMMLWYSVY